MAELELLGGQGMVLCSYDGMLYHGQSAICEKLIADKDLIKSFGSLLQCKCPIIFTYFNIIIHWQYIVTVIKYNICYDHDQMVSLIQPQGLQLVYLVYNTNLVLF